MSISDNVKSVLERIDRAAGGRPVTLVAVAKTKPAAAVREAIEAGARVIGENHVQEIRQKGGEGAYDGAAVHLVGHLQKNKVRYVAGRVDLIQSVDSAELLRLIDARAAALGTVQDVLLEINIAREPSKTGALPEMLAELLETASGLTAVRVRGLMAIPPAGKGGTYFNNMQKLFIDNAGEKYDTVSMDFLSMGMSDDFEQAIGAGANMVRVGSAIFGARDYGRPVRNEGGIR